MSGALPLPRGQQVHAWHARLDDPTLLDGGRACLSNAERERAARFCFEPGRRRFVASHAFLRELLARYLDRPPADLELAQASGGKPELAARALGLRFNLSHSGDMALAVIAAGREVGADVEFLGRPRPLESLAPRVLSTAELAQLESTAAEERQRAFLRAWTRKEAVLKANGRGIDRELTAVEVGVAVAERVVTLAAAGTASSSWSVASVDPAPGYLAAVAAQGPGLELVTRPYVSAPRAPGAPGHRITASPSQT